MRLLNTNCGTTYVARYQYIIAHRRQQTQDKTSAISNNFRAIAGTLFGSSANASDKNADGTEAPPLTANANSLREYKPAMTIDLIASRAPVIRIKNRIHRTSISDPFFAEPVVVCENQIILIGKNEGRATLALWDDEGNITNIKLRIHKLSGSANSAQTQLSETLIRCVPFLEHTALLPREEVGTVSFQEYKTVEAPVKDNPKRVEEETKPRNLFRDALHT